MDERDLIHDWNVAGRALERPPFRVQFDDETLRDGLQSPVGARPRRSRRRSRSST